jgi:hypothetical protein
LHFAAFAMKGEATLDRLLAVTCCRRGTSVRICTFNPWRRGVAGAVNERNRSRNSPGAGKRRVSGTTTAASAAPPISRSTTQPIGDDTLTQRPGGGAKSLENASKSFSPTYASTLASTAARQTRSFSSSTISGTRSSASPGSGETTNGRALWTRWQSARWFVQTVTVAEPLVGEASSARR